MATEYLDEGAKTFAASAWSGSGIADNNDFIADVGFGPIVAGLDWSALTTGIESLYFKPTSNGIVGGGSYGSLLIDADSSADAYIANYGTVTLYLSAAGGSAVINGFSCGPGSSNFLTGGSFGDVVIDGGSFSANASTIITGDVFVNAGVSVIEYHATDIDLVQVNGGTITLKRAPTVLTVNSGTVTLDPDSAESYTSKILNMNGGYLTVKDGAYPTANLDGGTVDFRQNTRAFAMGATAGNTSSSCKIYRHPDADISAITARGSSKVDVGGAIPL